VLTGIYVVRAKRPLRRTDQAIVNASAAGGSDGPSHQVGPARRVARARRERGLRRRRRAQRRRRLERPIIFAIFVLLTLGNHLLGGAAHPNREGLLRRRRGITGFQNGLAIAGDYMSAASFLGISALVTAPAITA